MTTRRGTRREPRLRLIATFPTTTAAIAMERDCRRAGLPGKLIPVPRSISASCGMAWCAPPEDRPALERLTEERAIPAEGWYYVML